MKFLSPDTSGRARRILLRGVIPAAAVVGAVLVTIGLATQQSAPEAPSAAPPSSSSSSAPTSRSSHHQTAHKHTSATADPHTAGTPKHSATKSKHSAAAKADRKSDKRDHTSQHALPASPPTKLRIPRIDVDTDVTKVGRASSDQIGVPKGKHINDAAWFDESPTPGQYGASVIVGHIDTDNGKSVFFRLGELRHGNKIHITRKDGKKVTYVVDKARSYPDRKELPTTKFLGGDVDKSGLRLVTCTDFDHKTGHYRGNTIIYAHLTHG